VDLSVYPQFLYMYHYNNRCAGEGQQQFARLDWTGLCIPLSLLGNSSANTSSRQRRIVGVVFCAVRVVSKESRRLILPRTSCFGFCIMDNL
jgi:hypothetical protein